MTETSSNHESLADVLRKQGVSDAVVWDLARLGKENGFLFRVNHETTQDEAETLAYHMVLEMREVASGEKTWDDVQLGITENGGSSAEAERMISYLRTTFYPLVADQQSAGD